MISLSNTGLRILRFISKKPTYGSEIKKFGIDAPYPELRRLNELGLVTMTREATHAAPPRKVYAITGKGIAFLKSPVLSRASPTVKPKPNVKPKWAWRTNAVVKLLREHGGSMLQSEITNTLFPNGKSDVSMTVAVLMKKGIAKKERQGKTFKITLNDVIIPVESKTYNLPEKNRIRDGVIAAFKRYGHGNPNRILTTESKELLFVNSFAKGEAHHTIFERDRDTYKCLDERLRDRDDVSLHEGDIKGAIALTAKYDCAFLDVCNSIENAIDIANTLRPVLAKCDVIAVTWCIRGYKKKHNDYRDDFREAFSKTFPGFAMIRSEMYRDTSPMFSVIMVNTSKRYGLSESPLYEV